MKFDSAKNYPDEGKIQIHRKTDSPKGKSMNKLDRVQLQEHLVNMNVYSPKASSQFERTRIEWEKKYKEGDFVSLKVDALE